jgi:imidazolonepropionase-like amidohydrolase
MQPVMRGEVPLMIHAQGLREIRAALKWSEAHSKLRLTLVGGRDAWQLADELAKRKVAVIYSEVFALPSRSSDAYDVQFSAPAVLHKAGVTVAISEVKHLWISGAEQSLETKHTRLAEKYRARPKAP